MGPFRFKLEQVRLYRKQLEEQAMQALAVAIMERDATLERIAGIERELEEVRTALCRADSLDSAERWLASQYETALKLDREKAEKLLSQQENHVDARRIALIKAAKERELLDKLKEKQAERHRVQERQQEQHTNDETATLRYTPTTI